MSNVSNDVKAMFQTAIEEVVKLARLSNLPESLISEYDNDVSRCIDSSDSFNCLVNVLETKLKSKRNNIVEIIDNYIISLYMLAIVSYVLVIKDEKISIDVPRINLFKLFGLLSSVLGLISQIDMIKGRGLVGETIYILMIIKVLIVHMETMLMNHINKTQVFVYGVNMVLTVLKLLEAVEDIIDMVLTSIYTELKNRKKETETQQYII